MQSQLPLPLPDFTVSQCSRAKCYKAISGGTKVCLLWLVLIADRSPHADRSFLPFATLQVFRCVWTLPGSIGMAGWCLRTWVSCSPASQLSTQKRPSKAENGRPGLCVRTCFCLMNSCNSRSRCSSCLCAQSEMKRNRQAEVGQLFVISGPVVSTSSVSDPDRGLVCCLSLYRSLHISLPWSHC